MKLNEALIIFLLTIFCAPQLFSTDFLITVSGHYELGTNLPGNGDSNGTIRIQASYVTLDLGNYTVFQGDSSANATGIVVDANLTDVNIRNGTINNFTGNGIQVGAGCQKIVVDNILTDSCSLSGITFAGTSGANIKDSKIQDSRVFNCCTLGGSSVPPIWLKNCQAVAVSGCNINSSGANNNTYGCVELDGCTSCLVENVNMYNNQSFGAVVLNQLGGVGSGSNGCVIKNCIASGASGAFSASGYFSVMSGQRNTFQSCKAINNGASNYYFRSNDSDNTFQECVFEGNSISAGATSYGFYVSSGSSLSNVSFIDCSSLNNTISNVFYSFYISGALITKISLMQCLVIGNLFNGNLGAGLYLSGGGYNQAINCEFCNNSNNSGFDCYGIWLNSPSNSIYNCKISQNSANHDFYGINIDNASNNEIKNCSVSNNSAIEVSVGITFSLECNNNDIFDSYFVKNNGGSDSASYGIANVGSNVFIKNIAYGNGPTTPLIGNQLYGLPTGSYSTPGRGGAGTPSGRMNTMRNAWTNLRITN